MAAIIIREAGQSDRILHFQKKEIIIGRRKGADLVLPHVTVSREHAKIFQIESDFFIENLSDQDNMLVNDTPRKRWELSTKDAVQIGKFTIIFFGNNLNPMEQFFEGTPLDEFPHYTRTTTANRQDVTFQMSPTMVKKMMQSSKLIRNARVISSEGNQEWTPGDKDLTFGKSGIIQVQGWFTGGTCAQITWNGNDHILKRLSAFAKINVNDEKLKEERFLNNGDIFQIGKNSFTYVIRD